MSDLTVHVCFKTMSSKATSRPSRDLPKSHVTDDQLSTADEYDQDIPITADREAELLDKTPTKSNEFPDPPESQNTAVPPTPVWRASMESQMNNLSAQISAFMSMHQSMMGSYQVGPPIGQPTAKVDGGHLPGIQPIAKAGRTPPPGFKQFPQSGIPAALGAPPAGDVLENVGHANAQGAKIQSKAGTGTSLGPQLSSLGPRALDSGAGPSGSPKRLRSRSPESRREETMDFEEGYQSREGCELPLRLKSKKTKDRRRRSSSSSSSDRASFSDSRRDTSSPSPHKKCRSKGQSAPKARLNPVEGPCKSKKGKKSQGLDSLTSSKSRSRGLDPHVKGSTKRDKGLDPPKSNPAGASRHLDKPSKRHHHTETDPESQGVSRSPSPRPSVSVYSRHSASGSEKPRQPRGREVTEGEDPLGQTKFAEDIDHFRRLLHLSDPGDKIPDRRTAGMGLPDNLFTMERRKRGPSSMLPMDEVLANTIGQWHESFRQFATKEGDFPRPPRSKKTWYQVADAPMEFFLQQENAEFSKVKRPNPSKTPKAEVPLPKLKDLETCGRESIALLNYMCHYSRVMSEALEHMSRSFNLAMDRSATYLDHPNHSAKLQEFKSRPSGTSPTQGPLLPEPGS